MRRLAVGTVLLLPMLVPVACASGPPPREVIERRRELLGLPIEPTDVHEGMEILARNEDLGLLDRLSLGDPEGIPDERVLDAALRAGSVLRAIRWEGFETGSPAEVETLVEETAERADRLAEAAAGGERTRYPELADRTASRCVECHVRWRPD